MKHQREDLSALPPLVEQKRILRSSIKSCLEQTRLEVFQWAGQVAADRLQRHPRWLNARAVLLYATIPGEIDTTPLFHLAKRSGKTIFYPRIEGEDIAFYQVDELLDLEPRGPWHIMEPRRGTASLSDWLATSISAGTDLQVPIPILGIIPGLAFDLQGGRLGRGKGYYDRFLSSIEHKKFSCTIDLYTLGICLGEQVLDQVPRSPHDIKVREVMIIERL
jgi:5-formyltetrahydrofolate cyclo-ligase